MLQFYAGSTTVINSKNAVLDCLEKAFINDSNYDCDLIVFHTTMGHDFGQILSEFSHNVPNAQ